MTENEQVNKIISSIGRWGLFCACLITLWGFIIRHAVHEVYALEKAKIEQCKEQK